MVSRFGVLSFLGIVLRLGWKELVVIGSVPPHALLDQGLVELVVLVFVTGLVLSRSSCSSWSL